MQRQPKRGEVQPSCPARACAACSDCCGLKYSACCAIFSLWGVIMLCVMGYLLDTNYAPIHFNELSPEDASAAASASFGAAGLYAGVAVLCGARFGYLMWASKRRVQRV